MRSRMARCSSGRTSRLGAAPRRRRARLASSTRCIGGWSLEGEPYTVAAGQRFDWWRARMLGGRTNHWGRISLRFGPDDFRRKSLDGLGDDWPISYDDLKPYYDDVDRLIGVFGSTEGLPNDPDGVFLPPPRPTLLRVAREAGVRPVGRAMPSLSTVDSDAAAQRSGRVPLLRAVQSRLQDELQLLEPRCADRASDSNWPAHAADQRDGARGDHGRQWTGEWRRIHRQADGARRARTGPGRRARGERLRVGAAPAQLSVRPLSRRTRQQQWRSRPLPDRHDGHRRRRGSCRSSPTTSRTTRTAWAACTSTCPGGSTTRRSTFRAGITSSRGAACGSQRTASSPGIDRFGRRRVRR